MEDLKGKSDYVENFYQTYEGIDFTKRNPQKPPSDEILMRMKQRMDRLNGNSEDAPIVDDNGNDVDQIEGRDDPIVALEPDELK